MKKYEAVIGLEIHAELNTESKIYCECKNGFGYDANTQICPICMGMPGTLPVLNKKVVDYAIKMGHALNCKINNSCRQDRKNYFYPDLPKGYQISQSDIPLCENGYLDIMVNDSKKTIGITRIHIEEDAGKLLHDNSVSGSLVDFNRCGVPLIEIVSEPDLRSSSEAKIFLETIKSILQYINISDCKMQEGSIRCDVNVSVREQGTGVLGTRCEMKNINSFSGAVRCIEYEIKRQISILEAGEKIIQETRRWDDTNGISITMRTKENANDYRFFPEPDLNTIVIDEKRVDELKTTIPELPNVKIFRYVEDLGLSSTDAAFIAFSKDKAQLFDDCIKLGRCSPKNISNKILSDVSKYINETGKSISNINLTAEKLVSLIEEIENGRISNTSATLVFNIIMNEDKSVSEIIEEKGFIQNSDEDYLCELAKNVISENEKSVNDYRNGKKNALGFLVGQCMKKSKGKANPVKINEIILKFLSDGGC